jgi:hypothetical protein
MKQQLSMVKGEERYIFNYEDGGEGKVIDAFEDLVNDQNISFDWSDAAVLSYQLGRRKENA